MTGKPASLQVYEHGWQSFSPAGLYQATATSPRPRRVERDRVVVSADGPVDVAVRTAEPAAAVEGWADELASRLRPAPLRVLPAGWCSWSCYWGEVAEQDVLGNLAVMDRLQLDVGVVQVDDGHQAELGDWVERSDRFRPLAVLAAEVVATGRRAGVWTAPFLVGGHVAASGGLAVSSDPLAELDAHGLELTRQLLRPAHPEPVPWEPAQPLTDPAVSPRTK